MSYVPKTPKRIDFCGCPPCGLCFVWVDDNTGDITDGVEKMGQDLLGRAPTNEEMESLKKAADAIHVANRNRHQRIDAELREADQRQGTERMLAAARVKQATKTDYSPATRMALDDMEVDWEDVENTEQRKAAARQAREEIYGRASEVRVEELQEALYGAGELVRYETRQVMMIDGSMQTYNFPREPTAEERAAYRRAAILRQQEEFRKQQAIEDGKRRMQEMARMAR